MNAPDPVPVDPVPVDPIPVDTVRPRTQRLRDGASRVDQARVVVTGKAIPVFQRAVKLTRLPTLLVMITPILWGLALAIVSLFADGAIRWLLLVIGIVVLLLGVAFGRRRKLMLAAVDNRAGLTNDFVQAFSAEVAWNRIHPHLTTMASDVKGPKQGFAMIRNWRNLLAIAAAATSGLDDYPRVAPFTPSSLRNTWLLGLLSLIAGAAAAILTVLVVVLLALGAL